MISSSNFVSRVSTTFSNDDISVVFVSWNPPTMEFRVLLTSPDDLRFSNTLDAIRRSDFLSSLVLFEGERRSCVRFVSLGVSDDYCSVFGVATLAPTDELGCHGPHIMGVWVHPDYRRRKLGTRLILALISVSLDRYETPPTLVAVTRQSLPFVLSIAQRDPRILVVNPFKGQ
ncbi:GNAT family N-acetyltransferase [Roseiflexus castenholzii]|uniref:GNAT family N-acetyltransferase n=1 Tax=Roseiflexus castenholzii TaxID=120962 RepID=UPI003C7CD970